MPPDPGDLVVMRTTGKSPYEGKMWARWAPMIWSVDTQTTVNDVFIDDIAEESLSLYIHRVTLLTFPYAFHLLLWNGRPVWVSNNEVIFEVAGA